VVEEAVDAILVMVDSTRLTDHVQLLGANSDRLLGNVRWSGRYCGRAMSHRRLWAWVPHRLETCGRSDL